MYRNSVNLQEIAKRLNVKEGDLVLLKNSQVKRDEWPMALIKNMYPGSDGKVC